MFEILKSKTPKFKFYLDTKNQAILKSKFDSINNYNSFIQNKSELIKLTINKIFKINDFKTIKEVIINLNIPNSNSNKDNYFMQVNPKTVSLDSVEVEVNLLAIFLENVSDDEIIKSLNHEFIHIEHMLYFKTLSNSIKITEKVLNKIKEISKQNTQIENIFDLRALITVLYTKTYIESIAIFFQEQRNPSLDNISKQYTNLEPIVVKLLEKLVPLIKQQEKYNFEDFLPFIKFINYLFGEFMVSNIYFINPKITKQDLMELSHVKLFQLYEKSVEVINLKYNTKFRPLLSFNSQKGIIDYQFVLKALNHNFETLKLQLKNTWLLK